MAQQYKCLSLAKIFNIVMMIEIGELITKRKLSLGTKIPRVPTFKVSRKT